MNLDIYIILHFAVYRRCGIARSIINLSPWIYIWRYYIMIKSQTATVLPLQLWWNQSYSNVRDVSWLTAGLINSFAQMAGKIVD